MNNSSGWILATVWIIVFILVISFNIESAKDMKLNEWGDLLAGFAAPLALLWIIIGYNLQKKELNYNNLILEKQQKELSRQVDELYKQNETLMKQNEVLSKSINATNDISEAIDSLSETYKQHCK